MAPKSKKQKQAEKEAELARIAEEERLAAEKAEKEREEEERLLKEEKQKRAVEEQRLQAELDARLEEERAANEAFYGGRSLALQQELQQALSGSEWETFIACEELPDVTCESDVNTFLTEWRETPAESADRLDKTLADATLCIELLRSLQLEEAWAAARKDAKRAAWQAQAQLELRAEMQRKLDETTADFLQRADEFANAKAQLCASYLSTPSCRFGVWVNLARNPRMKIIEMGPISVTCELPKALALASISVRVLQYHCDLVSPYASAEAMAASTFMTLGGVFTVELLSLPPGATKVKGWTMRLVSEQSRTISRMQYPMPNPDGSAPSAGSAPPLRLSFEVGSSVIMAEGAAPKVGYWDSEAEAWKEDDCVWDVEYQAETRTVSFFTIRLASLALLQPSYLEFPYKAWLFSPRGPKSGTLHLVTQRFTFHFDLSAAGVTLRAPRLDQLAALLDTPMAATTLLLRLRSCGINLCPRDADAACLDRVHPKEAHLEAACHEALMPLLPRYQLAASRWNLSRGAAKFMVRLSAMAEPMALADGSDEAGGYSGDGGGEKAAADPFAAIGDWPTLEYGLNRVLMTNALDSDVQCDDSVQPEAVPHSSPLDCLRGTDPDAADVLHSSSSLYQDTARQLFDALRPLSFTKVD